MFRRLLWAGFGLAMLGLAYFACQLMTAETRVRAVCETIKPGMPVAQLRQLAEANGLAPLRFPETGTSFVVETKTYGRYGCKILLESGLVKLADYHFAD